MTDCNVVVNTCRETIDRCLSRGESDIFDITFTEEGVPIDITGWVIRYTVRKSPPQVSITDDTDADISAVATLTDPTNGVCTFNIPPEDTRISIGSYYYDVKTETAGGEEDIPFGGTLSVQYSITQD